MWRVLITSCIISAAAASTLRAPPPSVRRLRGGLDALDDEEDESNTNSDAMPSSTGSALPIPPSKALTKAEILEKLNAIPVFCILNKENGVVGMRAVDDDAPSCCWFTDALEARALLEATAKANPEAGLHMGCHGLGAVFTRCGGWPKGEEPEGYKMPEETPTSADGEQVLLKLKGQHGLNKEVQPRLVELLNGAGIDAGCWQLPVFFCDELQSRSIVPVFLSPQDLATTWVKAGRSEDSIPENLTLMDIRMLVAQMQTDSSPWSLIQFVGSMESVKLAQEIQAADEAAAA